MSHDHSARISVSTDAVASVVDGGFRQSGDRSWVSAIVAAALPKNHVMQGATWTVAGHAANQLLRLASNLILTRLLFPEAFGLMALVTVFVQFLALFSDVGIGPSLIQNRRGEDEDFVNTAWTIQVVRGLSLWGVSCVLAWPVTYFYGQPILAQLIPVAGIAAAIAGFNSTNIFTTTRNLALGRRTLIEVASQAASIVVVVVAAWATRSVWSLVIGQVLASFILMILSHQALPGPANHFRWHTDSAQELFRFGRWVFLTTLLTYVGTQGDRILLGAKLDLTQFGIYSIAVVISQSLLTLFTLLGHRVFLPKFSQLVRERPTDLRHKYYRVRLYQDACSLPLAGLLYTCGAAAVAFLYDNRYEEAGRMLQILSVRVAFATICQLDARLLVAMAKPHVNVIVSGWRVLLMFTAVPLVMAWSSLENALWTIVAVESAAYLFYLVVLQTMGILRLRRELASLALFAAGVVVGKMVLMLN